ncbi:MAG: M43 family zinc metalloprotease [Bacteroidia bacterium]
MPGAKWDYRKYLNIWTVTDIINTNGLPGSVLGFAYLPSAVNQGLGAFDGIVMRSDRVGKIGTADPSDGGRTLTHEIGHYLGLLHTFDDGCAGVGSNKGDYCADTPPVNGTFTNQNCPSNGNSCNSDNPDLLDQWENYMDYANGSCMAMFTKNQKSIMHYALTTYSFRKLLVSNANLIATGVLNGNSAPSAFFSSDARKVCVGEPVRFFDISCKAAVDSRQWQFTGANISSTNKDTPVVIYNTPGRYKVTLTVSNANGTNTLAVDNYIEVRPVVAIDKPTVRQEFDKSTWDIGTGWTILDEGSVKFTRDSSVGFRDLTSLHAPIPNSVDGQRFQLVTPPIDMRPIANQNPKFSFMIAYLRQNAQSLEELRLYYSRGCGDNFKQFLYRNASFLSYSSNTYSPSFKPTSESNWKRITYSLDAFKNDSNISFMLEITSNEGNSVYIDDINIGQYNTSISNLEEQIALNIYPNPSDNLLNVSYLNQSGETEVWLENMEGKKIETLLDKTTQDGQIEVIYKRNATISNGIYLLKIRTNNQILNKKVIFAN